MYRRLDAPQYAPDVNVVGCLHQIADAGMRRILGAEYSRCFGRLVRDPNVPDFEYRDNDAFGIAQSDILAS